MPKVSVIIPVFNTEKYLKNCLDSLAGQTLKDIEILCIDDGSTDSSLKVLQEYAQKDPRVKVFQNPENRGLSYARNVGIDHACGEYIQFVDSDDAMELDALELLCQIAADNRLDVLKFNSNRSKENLLGDSVVNRVFSGCDMLAELIYQPFCGISPCFQLLDRNYVNKNHLRFAPELRYGEDVLFTFQVIGTAQRCMCINERKYIYMVRENSLTTGTLTDGKIEALLYLMKEIMQTALSDNDSLKYRQAKLVYWDLCYATAKADLARRLDEPDMTGWDPELQNIYQAFLSGRGWLESLIDRKKLSLNKEAIGNADKIYIFGAGNAAQRLIQILYCAGIEIAGVIVSDKKKNRKTVYGYPVYSVDEISIEGTQPLILSTVKRAYDEIFNLLREHGFDSIVNVCP